MTAKDEAILDDGRTAITTSNKVEAETTLNKKKIGGKEKEEMAKIVLRRLPPGMSKDELFAQLQPFQSEPCAFWFCPADMEMKPHAFSRAYLVFHEEKDAVQFSERFNGYVFVDKLEAQYLKFLDQYNQTLNAGTKKVIDFDVLVRQLEEKQRRQEEGMIQETPLTEYINKLSNEKGRKKQQKLVERIEKKQLLIGSSFSNSRETTPDINLNSDKNIKKQKSEKKNLKEIKGKNEIVGEVKKRSKNNEATINADIEIVGVGRGSQQQLRKTGKERRESGGKNKLDNQNIEKKEKTNELKTKVDEMTKKDVEKKNVVENQNIISKNYSKQLKEDNLETKQKETKTEEIDDKIENQVQNKEKEKKQLSTSTRVRAKDRPEREIYRPPGGKSLSSKSSTSKQSTNKTTVADKFKKQN
ncbi:unnamed protein product [Meloidogyne enterolobii]|uniref:Uncharacterized protein n=1 Tax=Meloidogyne enterolobii TaxID=390850 RepID=A0ACB1AMZ4_MELEN